MATMNNPRRALVLAGALVLAACEPAAYDSAPAQAELQTDVSTAADSSAIDAIEGGSDASDTADSASTLVSEGLHHLVAMSGEPGDDGALGAGCADEEAETLPDGDWYAFVVDYDEFRVTVDVACVYGPGTEQFEAYAATETDEDERGVLANHVVNNDVVHERTLRIAAGAEAFLASTQWEPITAAGFPQATNAPGTGDNRGVWLRLEDGVVTAVVQPYIAGIAAG
ncbi:hypothetical protein [Demequina muriae]|uniref:Uncharacterized protein n=1 Tax=Demequina muriae TaxID=3051664 RepID=A0ABT8GDX3_9MICO|nr:hypothetical protein [Demequina sp. EGI L300058]MDN4479627.1 hypothetical protein [Demequina sp. EGI L300058]